MTLHRIVALFCLAIFVRPASADEVGRCAGALLPPKVASRSDVQPVLVAESAEIDLLVAYVPAARSLMKSEAALSRLVKAMVNHANQAYRNSGTSVTFRLVGLHPLAGSSSGNIATDLQAATYTDGKWDELQTVREQYGADIVSVLITGTEGGKLCGRGWLNGATNQLQDSAPFMYNVVSIASICPLTTLAHELGHNMGSDHDRANTAGGGFQPFSYGWQFTGRSGQKWRTIMSTVGNRELPFFSSPSIKYDGRFVGRSGLEDNSTSLKLAALQIAPLVASKSLPDLALPPPAEPTSISVNHSLSGDKRSVLFKVLLRNRSTPIPAAGVFLYWSYGKAGAFKLQKFAKTNPKGMYTFKVRKSAVQNLYYRVCYQKLRPGFLCSAPVAIAAVR